MIDQAGTATVGTKGTKREGFQRLAKRLGGFLMSYYAIIIAVFFAMLILAAILAPILSYLGLDVIAKPIFYAMHFVCAQTPSHSFYIFGHQLCLCERCLAIYSAMFLGSLVFALSKLRLPGLRLWQALLLTVPIAADGFTQMFGLRESTWELRLITGALFGFAAIWYALPYAQKVLKEEAAYALAQQAKRSF
ncbi:MAG TPA: DUF2085 domain-containing protein [Ktedonobacteraceae bacterium]|nr:DUF2085 domain-containing protein [Ktedonobacteraceae bacterium]